MRILFDSKQSQFKTPFGTLTPGQVCTLRIHIPTAVGTTGVEILLQQENGEPVDAFSMSLERTCGAYDIYRGEMTLEHCGLYFYYFRINCHTGPFCLFKYGDDTNMEAGSLWQISCIPADFTTPDWAQGAVIYQLFPDRFHKVGECDLTGKLRPYTVHEVWDEEVSWQPTSEGLVLNNDFYGGNFKGITEKMDYIASLGTTILYLNPISKSFSSHRYDTSDYKTPDPMLGTEADFVEMCDAAHRRGMKVVLDGVYSHTGSNSMYFNKDGIFPGQGAYQSQNSPYYGWYDFKNWPNVYKSWWGFDTLPTVNKMHPDFIRYVITDADSVVAHWLKLGADGFRLDVVDELPDAFVLLLKQRIRQIKSDALLIGEVWEDASHKIAYGVRRRYFVDGILDSAMNYPFRQAILDYLWGRDGGYGLKNTVMTIAENYPPQVLACNMNLLGTHDTPRILTALVDERQGSRQEQAQWHLSPEQWHQAKERLLMASFLQFMLPGAPSIYYGDETGMEGHKDPFNRRTYPWGREEPELMAHFRQMGMLRKKNAALRLGNIAFFANEEGRVGFTRARDGKKYRIYCNHNSENWEIPAGKLLLGHNLRTVAPNWLTLGENGFALVEEN